MYVYAAASSILQHLTVGQCVFDYNEGFQVRRTCINCGASYSEYKQCVSSYVVCGDQRFPFLRCLHCYHASLVALWVATVTVFGVVTAVLSWQNFKLKQKGMLGHMDD